MSGKKDKVKDKDRYSILVPNLNTCFMCGTSSRICIHEVFHGVSARKKSKEDGMVLPLCFEHHIGTHGVHNNKELDQKFKHRAQLIWMENYGDGSWEERISQFIKRYGKSYIEEDD